MANPDQLVADIEILRGKLAEARTSIGKRFIGQSRVVDLTLTALICGGHAVLIGLPGLGKTRLVDTLSTVMGLNGNRIQFTPDLMPADILGSEILDTAADGTRSFRFIEGPVFCQLLMADEINRASPRTQSALLQAMQEKEVTIAGQHRPLGAPFHVLATQNPIEQEGTYPLPEAQLDRFLMHVKVDYPDAEAEAKILALTRAEAHKNFKSVDMVDLMQDDLFTARDEVLDIHMADELQAYIIQLIINTRDTQILDKDLDRWLDYGASPRATISLDRCARASAWLDNRDYVTPEDIQSMAYDVLRHRLILTYEAEAEGIDSDSVIERLISITPLA